MRCACYPFCVSISSCLFRPLCLLASVRSPFRPDADGGGRLSSRRLGVAVCLLAPLYSCRAASLSRRSAVPFHGSFDWCGSVPCPDVVGMGSEAVRHPVISDCLRRAD